MNRLYSIVFYGLIFTSFINAMDAAEEDQVKLEACCRFVASDCTPQDVKELIIFFQLNDIHNHVTTSQEARDYLVSVSLVNKECNKYANDPYVIKNIISHLSAIFAFYEGTIATKLNTPATKRYIDLNNEFFSEHLTKKDIKKLLAQGADVNYCRNVLNSSHDLAKYPASRQCYANCPLIFYATDSTEKGLDVVQCLLENGANIDRICNEFRPLKVAIRTKLPAMVELLLQYTPELPYYPGANYLADAIDGGNTEIIELLQKVYSDKNSYGLYAAVRKKDTVRIQSLFDHGADPDHELQNVTTDTLHNIIRSTEILQLFCDNGIRNQQLLAQMITHAQATKERAEQVIAILENAKVKLPQ